MTGDGDHVTRSRAASLIGVLGLARFVSETEGRGPLLSATLASLQLAIGIDPENGEAKYNLESALQRGRGLEVTEGQAGTEPAPGGSGAQGGGRERARQRVLPMATSLVFLSPLAALLALGVLLPIGASSSCDGGRDACAAALGLVEPPSSRLVATLATMIAAGTFLGVAAAQPVVERTTTAQTRTDAEAFVVVDISRSMLARRGVDGEERIERAKRIAESFAPRSATSGSESSR